MDDVREREAQAFDAESRGDYRRAIEIWKKILVVYPRWENGFAHYHLGNCYVDAGDFEAAIAAYGEAIAQSPNDPLFSDTLSSLLEARARGDI